MKYERELWEYATEKAPEAAGSWRDPNFAWHLSSRPDDAENWVIRRNMARDSGCLEQSNHEAIMAEMGPFLEEDTEDPDARDEHLKCSLFGWYDGISVRVWSVVSEKALKRQQTITRWRSRLERSRLTRWALKYLEPGNPILINKVWEEDDPHGNWIPRPHQLTDAFMKFCELMMRLEEYPVLDDEDNSRREYEDARESWDDWGAREFKKKLEELYGVEFDEFDEDAAWEYLMDNANVPYEYDGTGTHFPDLDQAARDLVGQFGTFEKVEAQLC